MQPSIPGLIVEWSGAIVDIPDGWQLCNGTNGTPDLRDKFVPGAGTTYSPGDAGGAVNHDHDFTSDGHTHDIQVGTGVLGVTPPAHYATKPVALTGTTDPATGLPAYYSLAYIQFLGV